MDRRLKRPAIGSRILRVRMQGTGARSLLLSDEKGGFGAEVKERCGECCRRRIVEFCPFSAAGEGS